MGRIETLRQAMAETSTSQSLLARLSGVHQPSISQFLAGKIEFSDEQLDRLLSCMGFRLEVTRRAEVPELTRSEWRSWRLHRQLATHLTRVTLEQWRPTVLANIERLRSGVRGRPHTFNLTRWHEAVTAGDLGFLRHATTGLDRDAIELREVTPLGGLLPEAERMQALRGAV